MRLEFQPRALKYRANRPLIRVMPSTPSFRRSDATMRWRRAATAAAATALGLVPAAGAMPGPVRTTFGVGAMVLARADIAIAALPEQVEVSAQDVARGYIDLPRVARLTVNSNSAAGFALEVLPLSDLLAGIDVDGTGAQVHFDAGGGSIAWHGLRGRSIPMALGFRLTLAPGTVPGRYPWPLAFSVRPLGN
jgi:hypothetical protein